MANIKLEDKQGNLTIEVPKHIANADPDVYVPWVFDNNPYSYATKESDHWLSAAFEEIRKRKFGWRWFAKNPLTYISLALLAYSAYMLVLILTHN